MGEAVDAGTGVIGPQVNGRGRRRRQEGDRGPLPDHHGAGDQVAKAPGLGVEEHQDDTHSEEVDDVGQTAEEVLADARGAAVDPDDSDAHGGLAQRLAPADRLRDREVEDGDDHPGGKQQVAEEAEDDDRVRLAAVAGGRRRDRDDQQRDDDEQEAEEEEVEQRRGEPGGHPGDPEGDPDVVGRRDPLGVVAGAHGGGGGVVRGGRPGGGGGGGGTSTG